MGKGTKKGSSPASKGPAPAKEKAYLSSDDAFKLLVSGNLSQLKSLLKQHLDPMQLIECQELVCTFHEPGTSQYPLLLAAAHLTNSKMFELLLKAPGADVQAAVSPLGFNCVFAIVSNQTSSGLDKLAALKLLESKGFNEWNKVVSFGKYRITAASMLCFSNQQHKPGPEELDPPPRSSNGAGRAGRGVYSDDDDSCDSDCSSDSGGSTISQEAIRQKMPQDREREMFEFLLERGLLSWPMEADALVDAFYQLLIMGRARPYIGKMLKLPEYQPNTPGYNQLVNTMLSHWGSNKLCKRSTPLLERLRILMDSTPEGRGGTGLPLSLTSFSYLISTVLKALPPRVELVEELLIRGLDPRMKLNVDLTSSSNEDEAAESSSGNGRPLSQIMTLTLPQLYSLKTYRDMSQAQKVVILLFQHGADPLATSTGRDMGPKPVTAYDLAAQGGSQNQMSDLLFAAMKAVQEAKAAGMSAQATAAYVAAAAEESRRSYNKRLRQQHMMGTSLALPPMGASFRNLMQPGAMPFSPVLPPGAAQLLERAEQCLLPSYPAAASKPVASSNGHGQMGSSARGASGGSSSTAAASGGGCRSGGAGSFAASGGGLSHTRAGSSYDAGGTPGGAGAGIGTLGGPSQSLSALRLG